ncbi:uncharacterized protein LOC103182504 [Callorhinchus milii]|uniref:uncharacterized protein LOC103182504 n=1 Tax=Callorhinchus milii TaxID=7868 RepID=UPI0004573EE4|nr:uncharacterized protein LOC103182504 [Callorhinchus milii]|eukprot:gi/632963207/ref/XP_007897752.1/ PREDICTED: uncharacterized protein LOC103182504 [Callorhinchus milii]
MSFIFKYGTTLFLLLGYLQANSLFLQKPSANMFLNRIRRASGFGEELTRSDNLERECIEELCDKEEAYEIFENGEKTNEFWKTYEGRRFHPPAPFSLPPPTLAPIDKRTQERSIQDMISMGRQIIEKKKEMIQLKQRIIELKESSTELKNNLLHEIRENILQNTCCLSTIYQLLN